MSNGIGKNPLTDISKVYLQQVVEKKKDDTYLEPDMKKRQANNEKARKELAKGPQMKNPHFESVEKSGWDAIKACADGYEAVYKEAVKGQDSEMRKAASAERKSGYKRLSPSAGKGYADQQKQSISYMDKKTKNNKIVVGMTHEEVEVAEADSLAAMQARREKRLAAQRKREGTTASGRDFGHDYSLSDKQQKARRDAEFKAGLEKGKTQKEALDPVGKEDGDVNNDGKKDSTDKYLMKRRAAIGKAMASTKKMKEETEVSEEKKPLPKNKMFRKAGNLGRDAISTPIDPEKRQKAYDRSKKIIKVLNREEYSSWRNDLSEVMTDEISDKPIKEKKVSNTIKINPKLGEAIEAMGGELIEATEVDEAVYGGTPKEEPKDTRMTVTNADKKGNTPAYQRFKAGDKRYKAADHMKEQAAMSDAEVKLQKQKARIDQMIAQRRKQDLVKKSEEPAKAVGEGLSVDDQMRISKEYNRKSPEEKKALNKKAVAGIPKTPPKKDTRTDAQKMTDATGPRPGSRYRGD